MSAMTAQSQPLHRVVDARLTFGGVMKGEWIKLLSLRSTWWTMAITVVVMTLLALAQASSIQFILEAPGMNADQLHGAEFVIGGYQLGMVTIAVLGALLMTGEYSTGMIRSTFAAVPKRLPVLAAKSIVLVVLTVLVSVVSLAASYLVALPFLSDHDLVPALDDSLTWQAFGGMTFFFVVCGLIGLGMGAILRHTAGTITAVLSLLFLVPLILQFINIEWVQDALNYVPLPAAMAFLGISGMFGSNDALTAWQGVAVVGAYAVVILVIGAVLMRRRDA